MALTNSNKIVKIALPKPIKQNTISPSSKK